MEFQTGGDRGELSGDGVATDRAAKLRELQAALVELARSGSLEGIDDLYRIPGLTIDMCERSQNALDDRTVGSLLDLVRANWSRQRPSLVDRIVEQTRKRLEDPHTATYLYRYLGEPVAFVCFQRGGDDETYVAALNVDPSLQKSGIGRTILETIVGREGDGMVLKADVLLDLSIGTEYVERYGFGISGIEPVALDDGTKSHKLLLYKNDQMKKFERTGEFETFDLATQEAEFADRVREACASGKFIVRYQLVEGSPTKRRIAVGDLVPDDWETAVA